MNTKIAYFHLYAVFYFTRFNQLLLDFFNLVDLRLILMPMPESIKITCVGFAAELLRQYDTTRYAILTCAQKLT